MSRVNFCVDCIDERPIRLLGEDIVGWEFIFVGEGYAYTGGALMPDRGVALACSVKRFGDALYVYHGLGFVGQYLMN